MKPSLDQIANILSQASYVLTCEGNNLTAKDIDAIISKVSRANQALCTIHDNIKDQNAKGQKA